MVDAALFERTNAAAATQPAPPAPPAPRFRQAPHVQQAEHAGTIILFDGRKYFTLPTEAARDLWKLLADPRSAEELANQLYELYDAPREVIADDVATQLARFRRERLMVEVGPRGEPLSSPPRWWRFWQRDR